AEEPLGEVAFTAPEMEALWADLADGDAARANRAVWALAASPRQTAPFLQRRLRPPTVADRHFQQHVRQLLADLDCDQFPVRERATEELDQLGEVAEPFLRRTLALSPSPELRRRAERLLEKLTCSVPVADQLRSMRAIEVLEHIDTPEAKQVLRELGMGAPEARLTVEAKAALKRLTTRNAAKP